VLYGGSEGEQDLDDTREWDGQAWQRIDEGKRRAEERISGKVPTFGGRTAEEKGEKGEACPSSIAYRPSSLMRPRPGIVLLVIAYLGFVSLGLPDAVGGVAWPSIRAAFGLPQGALGLILIAAGTGYFASSFYAGRLIHAVGAGGLLTGSSGLVVLSVVGYAAAGAWPFLLACAVVAGLGSGAIDAGLNAHAAHHFSPRHMNWLHACYGVGAMLGPLLMTGTLAAGRSWRQGYLLIGLILALMVVLFFATRSRWHRDGTPDGAPGPALGVRAVLRHPLVLLQMAVFFFYTAVEVTPGQWSFTLLTEGRGVSLERAGTWVSLYWAALTAGRVAFGFIADRVPLDGLLRVALAGALLGTALFSVASFEGASLAGLLLLGFSLAPVYPCLMALTPQRLDRAHAVHAIGFQGMAGMVGSVLLPSLAGLLVTHLGLDALGPFIVVLAATLYLAHEALVRRARKDSGTPRPAG
jgi:fucose permease